MPITPFFSLIMPVYNAMPYLQKAMMSILSQDFDSVEFIVIDDCSQDRSTDYLRSLTDKRIRLYRNENNKGMTYSLNRALSEARGEYITRLDADDISTPDRFSRQYELLTSRNDLILLGGSAVHIDENEAVIPDPGSKNLDDSEIKWRLFFNNPFIHSATSYKRKILIDNNIIYHDLAGADDYKMWCDLAVFGPFYITGEVFCHYRVHAANMTTTKQDRMQEARVSIAHAYTQKYLPSVTVEETKALMRIYKNRNFTDPETNVYTALKRYTDLVKRFSWNDEKRRAILEKEIIKILSYTNRLSIQDRLRFLSSEGKLIFRWMTARWGA